MNLEEFGKKVMKISKDTVTEVQKMNEVRQLNAQVSDEKKLLNRLYLEMGQKLYDKYREAEQIPEGFEEDFQKIEERYSVIDLLQDQIRKVKGVTLCPCCNMEVAITERYCSNCGNRMPEVVRIEEKREDEDAIVVESTVVEPEQPDSEGPEVGEAPKEGVEAGKDPEKGVEADADPETAPEMEVHPNEGAADMMETENVSGTENSSVE